LRSDGEGLTTCQVCSISHSWIIFAKCGCLIKNLLSQVPPCFGRHVKPLFPAAFAVVSTHQFARHYGLHHYGPFPLCVIHKEGLCSSSEDINRLMMTLLLYVQEHITGIFYVQSTAHQNILFGLCKILISMALEHISNCKCIALFWPCQYNVFLYTDFLLRKTG
jgi:hypothetical protein